VPYTFYGGLNKGIKVRSNSDRGVTVPNELT
jgi:hypothetical protein